MCFVCFAHEMTVTALLLILLVKLYEGGLKVVTSHDQNCRAAQQEDILYLHLWLVRVKTNVMWNIN